jgi:hypothetical protein
VVLLNSRCDTPRRTKRVEHLISVDAACVCVFLFFVVVLVLMRDVFQTERESGKLNCFTGSSIAINTLVDVTWI